MNETILNSNAHDGEQKSGEAVPYPDVAW